MKNFTQKCLIYRAGRTSSALNARCHDPADRPLKQYEKFMDFWFTLPADPVA
jgi:hypothetical protein|uniref:Uncharacterized protein n=1 Tax=Herbaspirillum huttiense subsp. nephrolepidis TaxID=3075126 RepID=A0AAE4K8Z5_9BURK